MTIDQDAETVRGELRYDYAKDALDRLLIHIAEVEEDRAHWRDLAVGYHGKLDTMRERLRSVMKETA